MKPKMETIDYNQLSRKEAIRQCHLLNEALHALAPSYLKQIREIQKEHLYLKRENFLQKISLLYLAQIVPTREWDQVMRKMVKASAKLLRSRTTK
jgi:hypothetical protein